MVTVTADSRARIRTSMGDMTLEFLVDKAPRTVENFVSLVHKGFYDGLTFHRILSGFIIQGGCRNGNGTGKADYTIRPEFNDTPHVKGVVSMARNNDPHSAFSQFFICHGEARYLDSRYTAFARVIDGLDVLDKIASVPTNVEPHFGEKSVPRDPVYINGVELEGVEFEGREVVSAEAPVAEPESAAGSEGGEADEQGAVEGGDAPAEASEERRPRRTRRGGRGRRGGGKGEASKSETVSSDGDDGAGRDPAEATKATKTSKARDESERSDAKPAPRRRSRSKQTEAAEQSAGGDGEDDGTQGEPSPKPRKKATRRRKPSARKKTDGDSAKADEGE